MADAAKNGCRKMGSESGDSCSALIDKDISISAAGGGQQQSQQQPKMSWLVSKSGSIKSSSASKSTSSSSDSNKTNGEAVHVLENPLNERLLMLSVKRSTAETELTDNDDTLPNGDVSAPNTIDQNYRDEVAILMPNSDGSAIAVNNRARKRRTSSLERILITLVITLFLGCLLMMWVAIFRKSSDLSLSGMCIYNLVDI
jgi:cobalamin biosynthesis Mg chelatase CobN